MLTHVLKIVLYIYINVYNVYNMYINEALKKKVN